MNRPIRLSRPHYGRVALALSLGMVLGGCHRTTDPAALIAEARQYRQQGDINAAVIQLKNALQKDPDNRDARRLLGEVYIDQADAVSAENELRRALALGTPSTELLILLGKSMLLQTNSQRASACRTAGDAGTARRRPCSGSAMGRGSVPPIATQAHR